MNEYFDPRTSKEIAAHTQDNDHNLQAIADLQHQLQIALDQRDLESQYHNEAHQEISALYCRLEDNQKTIAQLEQTIKELKVKLYDLISKEA